VELGEKLQTLRESRGYMQRDVAANLEIAPNTLSGYERGLRNPDSEILIKLAKFYGVTVDFLLGTENSVSELEEEMPEGFTVLRRMKTLSPLAKNRMIQIMKTLLEEEERVKKED